MNFAQLTDKHLNVGKEDEEKGFKVNKQKLSSNLAF